MNDITVTQRQTQAYWFIDGLAELVGGAIIAVVGVLLYASTLAGSEALSTMALMVMIVGFPFSAIAVRRAKDKITHSRTGYVKFSPPSGRRRGIAVIVAVLAGIALGVFAVSTDNYTYDGPLGIGMTVGLGVAISAVLAIRAYRLELSRFYISAAAVGLSAVGAIVAGLGFIAGMGVMWIVLGVVSILTGATVFAEYMAAHPYADPAQEADPS